MSDIFTRMLALYSHMKPSMDKRRGAQPDCVNVLPVPDFDFTPLFEEMVPSDYTHHTDGKRKDMVYYKEVLRASYPGQPEILPLHMLLNAYLRRETQWNDAAKRLFFRLWHEHTEALIAIIPTRDLVSALRSFSEYSDDQSERQSARLAFVYATMLKAYESERKRERMPLEKARYNLPFRAPNTGLSMRGLAFADDDGVAMINFMVADEILEHETLGQMILLLLTRIFEGDSVFSRMDRARLEIEFDLRRKSGWGWGFNPRDLEREMAMEEDA